jgi:SAM-dependent methyltransferase
MNLKVKFRESFRPFAPVVLREHTDEYFDIPASQESPYMLLVAPVQQDKRLRLSPDLVDVKGLTKLQQHRSQIPAVTHVDYSARIQTVDAERHGLFRQLMEVFYHKTGCPVMINTSFNLGWDPIVCSPREAYKTFMASDIDVLCMGHCMLMKCAQPAHVQAPVVHGHDEVLTGLLCSPCHGADLDFEDSYATCTKCGRLFHKEDGIWSMFWPHAQFDESDNVTQKVKAFYEETPFPNYDNHDSVRLLIEKARQGGYAQALDHSIPYNSTVREVGCGTGQLSNFLGISCRRVVGVDICLNSLNIGERFREKHGLDRVRFVQMNLFRSCFKPEQFDVILCNGVLHHTADPFSGFQGLLPLLKRGGYIGIGLYNRYGRLLTDLRRQVFRLSRGHAKWIDPILRRRMRGEAQSRAWFADQYCHPHESKHTIGEVIQWFDRTGIEFLRGVPSVTPKVMPLDGTNLFTPERRGTTLDHFLVQTREVFAGSREGGYFLMIGRKPAL